MSSTEKNSEEKTIASLVLEKIKSGGVTMRPRWYFVLQTTFAVVGGFLLACTLLYLVSFILFVVHRNGVWFVPSFGARGWYAFLFSLPWVLIALSAVFVVLLELLVKHYAFAYRRPFLYSVLGILLFVIAGGFIVSRTPLHRGIEAFTETHGPPFARGMYHGFERRELRDIHRGVISEMTQGGFLLNNLRGESLTIVITRRTRLPLGMDFELDDQVVVFGDRDDHHVEAFGIRKVSE